LTALEERDLEKEMRFVEDGGNKQVDEEYWSVVSDKAHMTVSITTTM